MSQYPGGASQIALCACLRGRLPLVLPTLRAVDWRCCASFLRHISHQTAVDVRSNAAVARQPHASKTGIVECETKLDLIRGGTVPCPWPIRGLRGIHASGRLPHGPRVEAWIQAAKWRASICGMDSEATDCVPRKFLVERPRGQCLRKLRTTTQRVCPMRLLLLVIGWCGHEG